jgi:2-dehydro-3-deoxyphosphooctonate aldolase (KDO 8-P synthase)
MTVHAPTQPNAVVQAGNVEIGNASKLTIIAGPCQLESRAHAFDMAGALKEACDKAGVGLVYKTSFDKANLTDVHERDQCAAVAQAVDILQIPAFLSRQTDLLVAAAHTGRIVNVKKGQFLSPYDMKNVIAKITAAGNPNVLVTERGVSFGYNTLVSDMRSLPIMAGFGAPVVFDATHSVQAPGGQGDSSGGDRNMVPYLARAAVAAGVAAVFMEVHQDPEHAPSDGPNMVRLKDFPALLQQLVEIDVIVKR